MCTKIDSVVTISALSMRSDALTVNFELKYCLSNKRTSALKIKWHGTKITALITVTLKRQISLQISSILCTEMKLLYIYNDLTELVKQLRT